MQELLQYLGVHLWFFPWYPVVLWELARGDPWVMLGWVAIGGIFSWVCWRFWRGFLLRPFIAAWFMPASIICGAAGIWPLPAAAKSIFAPGRCATPASVLLSFLLNCALLYGGTALVRWWRRRRCGAKVA